MPSFVAHSIVHRGGPGGEVKGGGASRDPLMQLESEVMVRYGFLRRSSYRVGNAFQMSYLSYFGTPVLYLHEL